MPNPRGSKIKLGKAYTRAQIDNIIYSFPNEHDKILFMVQYLTASRISEALNTRSTDYNIEIDSGKKFLVVTMQVLKRRKPILRKAVIPIEDEYVPYILEYLSKKKEGELLFNITKSLAWSRLTRLHPKMRTHIFRHSRITELVTKYGFNTLELVQFIGWSNLQYAATYVHLSSRDIARKFTFGKIETEAINYVDNK